MNDSEDWPEVWGRVHATAGAVVEGAGAEVAGAELGGDVVTTVVAGMLVCDDELLQPVETKATIEMSATVGASIRLGVFIIL
ncbi:MAG: hypothetical protein M3Q30_07615 [Actinomycetota bacterium]|nr:hypothetical protein [Actinomycetota bacterium]